MNAKLTLNVRGPSYLGQTNSISWLLMPWLLASPGHQQLWYWLYRICWSTSYLRKGVEYLCHISVEEWHKMWIYAYVLLKLQHIKGFDTNCFQVVDNGTIIVKEGGGIVYVELNSNLPPAHLCEASPGAGEECTIQIAAEVTSDDEYGCTGNFAGAIVPQVTSISPDSDIMSGFAIHIECWYHCEKRTTPCAQTYYYSTIYDNMRFILLRKLTYHLLNCLWNPVVVQLNLG